MRILLTFILLIVTSLGFGQQVNAPDPKEFTINTSAQDASGFNLSGFNSTSILLCAIGLPISPNGTTFYMTTTTGLTPASGYTMSGNKTRLAFTGTMTNINNALSTLKINTTATAGNIQISVSATINPTGYFYNPSNGHFYRPISSGATYPNAKTLSSQQTFKGQQGYLVTITSSDEDAFIFNNVPQNQIWFALTDEVVEGQWRIDAGPENGTLIKTSNGQTAGNIVGQYNNWAGGEPNNSGNEDYAVTKWNGSQWNDLPAHFSCPYVIEFGTWANPDDQTFTEFYNNSTIHSNGVNTSLRANFSFNFGGNIDETKFLGALFKRNDTNSLWVGNTFKTLNGLGRVTLSEQLDTAKIFNGQQYYTNTSGGQVEWCVVYDYEPQNQRYQILIDKREFPQGISSNSVKSLQLFDLWNGPVTYQWDDGTWAAYWIYTPTEFNFAGSSFTSHIRRAGFFWGLSAEFTFAQLGEYKQHKFQFQNYDSVQLKTLYNSIVTVSDVYLAFKELADAGGIFGGGSGTQFGYGIQFKNADVNDDGYFNEADCFALLQNLTGSKNLVDNYTLDNTMKIILDSTYGTIGKSNWQQFPSFTGKDYGFSLLEGKINYTYNLAVSWKGDVNLSHSATPPSNGITTNSANFGMTTKNTNVPFAYIITQIVGDSLIAIIKFTPNSNPIVGIQFQLNYDNSHINLTNTTYKTTGTPINFSNDKGSFINLGSLNTSGESLGENTEYQLTFKIKKSINNSLGLISISSNEVVDVNGKTSKIKIQ